MLRWGFGPDSPSLPFMEPIVPFTNGISEQHSPKLPIMEQMFPFTDRNPNSRQTGFVHNFAPIPKYKHIMHMPVRLGCLLIWTKKTMYKHIMPVRLGCPKLWKKKPCTNISCQLGWDVHDPHGKIYHAS